MIPIVFIRFKVNDIYVYGKIIGLSKNNKPDINPYETSVIIESLDGQQYIYDVYKAVPISSDGVIVSGQFLVMGGGASEKVGDAFKSIDSMKVEDVSVSVISKHLFNSYEEVRGLIGPPLPLNQHTANLSVNLFRGLFNSIALNNYLRERYPALEVKQVSLSDFDEDRYFVSFLNVQGERVPGKLIEIDRYGIVVEDLSGHKTAIVGEALNTVFQDKSVRLLFQHPYSDNVDTSEIVNPPIVQRQGEGFSYEGLEMSGDPDQDAFRKALIAGRFEGDERFISFLDQGERRLAKIISWEENLITLRVYKGNEDTDWISVVTLHLLPIDP